jgi:hypothetical protein
MTEGILAQLDIDAGLELSLGEIMDLREIQALHAQYTAQPVIIDIASHTAAMPALPAPEHNKAARVRTGAIAATFRKGGKPALIALAVAAMAAGGGMSVARIWHAMHDTVGTSKSAAAAIAAGPAAVAASGADATMPINVAPARALTSKDLDSQKPVAPSALANVDPRSLAAPAPDIERPPESARAASVEMSAAASPIRVQRPATSAGNANPVPASASEAAPATVAAPPQVRVQINAASTPAPTAAVKTTTAPEAPKAASRSALHPLRHITHSNPAAANSDTSPEPAAPVQPRTPAVKSGDVQLF